MTYLVSHHYRGLINGAVVDILEKFFSSLNYRADRHAVTVSARKLFVRIKFGSNTQFQGRF